MRRLGRRGLSSIGVALAATLTAGGPGCSSHKPTELVPGVISQVQVPRDLQAIRVEVLANGRPTFCQNYDVYDGVVLLPRTLGVISATSAQTTVQVTIRGYDQLGAQGSDVADCFSQQPVGSTQGPGPRTIRRSIQTFVDQHVLFLPMPLSYSCFDEDCSAQGEDATCKGAQCVPSEIDSAHKLVDFDPTLVDGTGICFSPSECFGDQRSAQVVDADHCVYAYPGSLSAGAGLNVRVFYQDYAWKSAPDGSYQAVTTNAGEQEILDQDDVEGFIVQPNHQFQLAPGLCNLAKANAAPPTPPGTLRYRAITDVQVGSRCAPKSQLLPICATERSGAANLPDGGTTTDGQCNVAVPLLPAPSALYLVMDDSAVMHGAFGPNGYATAMSLSLTDPVFKRTYVGFKFLSHRDAECTSVTTSFTTPDVDFGLAPTVQASIASRLQTPNPPDTAAAPASLDLQAAMRLDAGAYAEVLQFLRGSTLAGTAPSVAGAMFFLNRTPGGDAASGPLANDCSPPLAGAATPEGAIEAEAQSAFVNVPSLRTYFVVFNNDASDPGPLQFFQDVASAVPEAVTTLDGTSADPSAVIANFASVVTQLSTCLYELPAGFDPSAAFTVQYANPALPAGFGNTTVPQAANCDANHEDTTDGWSIDGGRLRICGQSCDDLRQVILASTASALQQGQSAPDVPVTFTVACPADGGATTPGGDASTGGDASDAASQ